MNTTRTKTTKKNNRNTDYRPALTEQERCDILDSILNRTGMEYTETQLDAIDEAFDRFINLVI